MDHFILHTGQHYSYNMDKVFFEQLDFLRRSITGCGVRHAWGADREDACEVE